MTPWPMLYAYRSPYIDVCINNKLLRFSDKKNKRDTELTRMQNVCTFGKRVTLYTHTHITAS